MKKGRLSKELPRGMTNNDIFGSVFDACSSLLNEDTELSLELTNETAYPKMSDYKNK